MSVTNPHEQILKVAREQFFTHGFGAVTMDDIARELRMSKRTLYQHFAGKQELLLKALQQKIQEIGSGLDLVFMNDDLPFIEKMTMVLEFLSRNLPRPSKAFVRDVNRLAPDIWKTVDLERSDIIQRYFSRLLEEGIREGAVRRDINPELSMTVLLTLIQHLITPEALSHFPVTLSELFEQIVDLFFQGVLTEQGRAGLSAPARRLS